MSEWSVKQQGSGETAENGMGHGLIATDRREITVKGVSEVLSFDESLVRLVTVCGVLNLEGEGFRVHVLNLKDGIVAVTGRLCGVLYEDADGASATEPSTRETGFRGRKRPRRW
jgi:sporulation protein YabP